MLLCSITVMRMPCGDILRHSVRKQRGYVEDLLNSWFKVCATFAKKWAFYGEKYGRVDLHHNDIV